jgi:hypothetical protein
MALIARNSGGDIAPLSAETHHGVCYSIVDIGTQPSNNPKFRAKHQVIISWEIPNERIDLEVNGEMKNLPRAISKTLTLSLSPKSTMRPLLESWRGRPFTEAELDGFDLKNILGANALVSVVHTPPKDGKVYANVASVAKLMKGMAVMKGELPQMFFDMDTIKGKFSLPPSIPDWIKAKIMQSEEWNARMGDGHQPDAQQQQGGGFGTPPGQESEEDQNVPF